MERAAFAELETAMIDSAMPKNQRLGIQAPSKKRHLV
jgi:hypothetical protein